MGCRGLSGKGSLLVEGPALGGAGVVADVVSELEVSVSVQSVATEAVHTEADEGSNTVGVLVASIQAFTLEHVLGLLAISDGSGIVKEGVVGHVVVVGMAVGRKALSGVTAGGRREGSR